MLRCVLVDCYSLLRGEVMFLVHRRTPNSSQRRAHVIGVMPKVAAVALCVCVYTRWVQQKSRCKLCALCGELIGLEKIILRVV